MENTAIFNHKGKFKNGDYANVGEVDGAKSQWVVPQDMQVAYYSYSRSDLDVTTFDVMINGVVADTIIVNAQKGTGSIDIPVVAGDEITIVNSGVEVEDVIVVIAFSDAIPFDPVTPLYDLTLQIFYDITGVSYAKYIENSPKVLHKR